MAAQGSTNGAENASKSTRRRRRILPSTVKNGKKSDGSAATTKRRARSQSTGNESTSSGSSGRKGRKTSGSASPATSPARAQSAGKAIFSPKGPKAVWKQKFKRNSSDGNMKSETAMSPGQFAAIPLMTLSNNINAMNFLSLRSGKQVTSPLKKGFRGKENGSETTVARSPPKSQRTRPRGFVSPSPKQMGRVLINRSADGSPRDLNNVRGPSGNVRPVLHYLF